jgi:hypothetical protein
MKRIISWQEVRFLHGTNAAISTKGGSVESLLCGGNGHSDIIHDDQILYNVPNRKFYFRSLEILQFSLKNKSSIKVFQKIQQNNWQEKGLYKIKSITLISDNWVVDLKPCVENNK